MNHKSALLEFTLSYLAGKSAGVKITDDVGLMKLDDYIKYISLVISSSKQLAKSFSNVLLRHSIKPSQKETATSIQLKKAEKIELLEFALIVQVCDNSFEKKIKDDGFRSKSVSFPYKIVTDELDRASLVVKDESKFVISQLIDTNKRVAKTKETQKIMEISTKPIQTTFVPTKKAEFKQAPKKETKTKNTLASKERRVEKLTTKKITKETGGLLKLPKEQDKPNIRKKKVVKNVDFAKAKQMVLDGSAQKVWYDFIKEMYTDYATPEKFSGDVKVVTLEKLDPTHRLSLLMFAVRNPSEITGVNILEWYKNTSQMKQFLKDDDVSGDVTTIIRSLGQISPWSMKVLQTLCSYITRSSSVKIELYTKLQMKKSVHGHMMLEKHLNEEGISGFRASAVVQSYVVSVVAVGFSDVSEKRVEQGTDPTPLMMFKDMVLKDFLKNNEEQIFKVFEKLANNDYSNSSEHLRRRLLFKHGKKVDVTDAKRYVDKIVVNFDPEKDTIDGFINKFSFSYDGIKDSMQNVEIGDKTKLYKVKPTVGSIKKFIKKVYLKDEGHYSEYVKSLDTYFKFHSYSKVMRHEKIKKKKSKNKTSK